MRFTPILRLLNKQTLESLKTTIKESVSEAPQYINTLQKEQKKIVYDKLVHLNRWYTKLVGLDEVKVFHDRVVGLQEQLLKAQDKRREIGRQLAEVRRRSIELQDEIHKVKRQDEFEKFMRLMQDEAEVLKLENSISLTFQEYDQMERELFAAFTNAIRDSHEKQRAQIEYTKYFGLILSITASFLIFIYGTVKKHDLKMFIEEQIKSLDATNTSLVGVLEKTVSEIVRTREELHGHVKNIQYKSNSNFQEIVSTKERLNNVIKSIQEKIPQNTSVGNSSSTNQTVTLSPEESRMVGWAIIGIGALLIIGLISKIS